MAASSAIAAPSMFAVLEDSGDSAGGDWLQVRRKPRKVKAKPALPQSLTGRPVAQPVEFYAVVDFECTCERGDSWWLHEIIEFPVVIVNARSRQVELGQHTQHTGSQTDAHLAHCTHLSPPHISSVSSAPLRLSSEFHSFVRPTERPKLTAFCTELTGITQDNVDSAPTLPTVLDRLYTFLQQHNLTFTPHPSPHQPPTAVATGQLSCCWVCDGQSDFLHFLHGEVSRKHLSTPPHLFSHYCDIRLTFTAYLPHCSRPHLRRMLREVGLRLVGRLHSGLDDARNVARLLVELIGRGAVVDWTNQLPAD